MSKLHVEALLHARAKILDKRETFVCYALPDWFGCLAKNSPLRKASEAIREQIHLDLGFNATLESYVAESVAHFPYAFTARHRNKMRRTRLAWIDAMIEYWKDRP